MRETKANGYSSIISRAWSTCEDSEKGVQVIEDNAVIQTQRGNLI